MSEHAITTAPKPNVPMKEGRLAPTDFDGLQRVCHLIAHSGLAPKGAERPEQLLVAVAHGMEAGLSLMQALQGVMVVNNRPCIWGDAALALVEASGLMSDYHQDVDDTRATVTIISKRRSKPIISTFSVDDAKRAGLWGKSGPWTQHPRRMLLARARAFALRDGFADVLRGVAIREEVEDYAPPAPAGPTTAELVARVNAIEVEPEPAAAVEPAAEPIGSLLDDEHMRRAMSR